ncbi:asparagine synthase-related protein [Streptomyces sp. NEAU-S7GS2]|uniref:asparagine synthase-related protein n=1 Tax=Streptomyces sp. NEAU-S7GS2 TaxID=2202000 RepID=UPI000D6F008F|nr:asparagine synthase-related protein [Streptomyces sp. NEAU-S7GS2]AWN26046.1 asparagine synthase [Streptomyces sp. NEAU-S7GS2]
MERTLPAATGFLAAVHQDGGRAPAPVFASLGSCALEREERHGHTLHTGLLHTGAPEAARAYGPRCAVVFAGELYNQAELRSLLPPGAGPDGDAQLVRALFDIYDLHAFRLLNGRFAALVQGEGRVLLATDHAGSVPLYLTAAPGRVLAATEAKALRTAPTGRPLPAARPVRRLPGVHQVPAGTVLEVALGTGGCTAHRTWAPPLSRRILPEDEAVAAVRRALEDAVQVRMGPEAPLVVLSGGIDSSSVAALAAGRAAGPVDTVSMGTDEADEFPQARVVAAHLQTAHRELTIPTDDLLRRLPHTVWAAESLDPDIIEYLLPLTALYLRLGDTGRRILTGYGADIPLGGMHREDRLPALDTALAHDMETFDGLNEMSPVLSGIGGHWSTHPYWDREVLDVLVPLEAGLKRRYGQDKWVLRAAMGDVLPQETVLRPKLGVHEGSGTTSSFSRLLTAAGVPEGRVHHAKRLVVQELFDQVVVAGRHPDEVATEEVVQLAAGQLESRTQPIS